MEDEAPTKAALEKEREERIKLRRERILQKIEAQKAGGEVDALAERERRKQVRSQPDTHVPCWCMSCSGTALPALLSHVWRGSPFDRDDQLIVDW